MKKRVFLALVLIVALAAGGGLGVGLGWSDYGRDGFDPFWYANFMETIQGLDPKGGPPPKVEVAEEEFDMGDLQEGSAAEHVFRVTNVGVGDLELARGGTTCNKCTMNDLPKDRLAQGESVDVTVSFRAMTSGPFRQTAVLLTNDVRTPRIPFVVTGKVISPLKVAPSTITFSRLSPTVAERAEVTMLVFGPTPLEILSHEFTQPESAANFEATIAPMTADEAARREAHSGAVVTVTAKPGLPLGTVHQVLKLTTNQEKSTEVNVAIDGQVLGDVWISGPGWNPNSNSLSLNVVDHHSGLRRQVYVMARGPHRADAQLRVASCTPDWLQTELGAPEEVRAGTVTKWPLTVIIPPGSPNSNYSGSEQGLKSEILLESSIPDAKQLRLPVRFLVE